jgi:hypothetical protein
MKEYKYKYKTTEDFIKKSKETHGDKYNYSLSEYVNAKTNVKIICSIHGIFEQRPRYHISGYNCPKCSGKNKTNEDIISDFIKIHTNKYNYSLVNYKNSLTPVKIICPEHGEFEQRPKDHLVGKGCQKCSGTYMDTTYFIEKANKKHNFSYSYSKTIFKKATEKVVITCEKHGDFEQTPNAHLTGAGCSICNESKGEKEIRKYLIENSINFIPQHRFDDCRNINTLPFDFYLPEHNICIEFNGPQHYKPFNFFGGEEKLIKTQFNDLIKINYCNDNKINLLIINEINTIKSILNNISK